MITEFILNIILTPVTWLLEAIPTVTWPTWLDDFAAYGTTLGEHLNSVNGWLPIREGVVLISWALGLWAIYLAIHGIRWLVSLFTGGGGVA